MSISANPVRFYNMVDFQDAHPAEAKKLMETIPAETGAGDHIFNDKQLTAHVDYVKKIGTPAVVKEFEAAIAVLKHWADKMPTSAGYFRDTAEALKAFENKQQQDFTVEGAVG